MRGKFVVLEGIDGSGKTTLARRISSAVGNAVITSEPTDGKIGAALRSGELGDIPPAAEALLFAADRAVHTETIKKILDSGTWVICDRYIGSTVAYQATSMGQDADWEWLIGIQKRSVIEPDVTFLLDIDPEEALRRVGERGNGTSRFERPAYLKGVRSAYLRLKDRFGYCVIDASKDADSVFADVMDIMERKGLHASK